MSWAFSGNGFGENVEPMSMRRVDYDEMAKIFDRSRALSPAKKDLWLSLFESHLCLDKTSRVLDVGCGTGRFAVVMAKQLRCAVVGIDPSSSMLAKAREKCPTEIEWLLGKAEALPFADNLFDACLASQVIHHFEDKYQAFVEIYRVLRPGGRIGIRSSSHAQLETILDYKLFPSAFQIDRARMPDIPIVRSLMLGVGFSIVEEQSARQALFESTEDYLKKLQDKYASVLALISDEEYQVGLEKAAAYFRNGHSNSTDRYAEITFLVGIK